MLQTNNANLQFSFSEHAKAYSTAWEKWNKHVPQQPLPDFLLERFIQEEWLEYHNRYEHHLRIPSCQIEWHWSHNALDYIKHQGLTEYYQKYLPIPRRVDVAENNKHTPNDLNGKMVCGGDVRIGCGTQATLLE